MVYIFYVSYNGYICLKILLNTWHVSPNDSE